MEKPMIDIDELEQLIEARGPSGNEFDVAKVYADLVEPHVDSINTDDMGNVVATSTGDPDAHEIMLAAHTDELSFVIDTITDDGFLQFRWLGAHYAGNFAGQNLKVGPDEVHGVIGPKSRHRMSEKESDSLPDEWFIDVGATSAEEVHELNVRIGDYATWDQGVTKLASDRFAGRAMDDRLGIAVMLGVARAAETDATVHYVATVQEEPGLRGAKMTGYKLDPDIALAIDIFPGDSPGKNSDRAETFLGNGPVVELAEGVGNMLNGVLVDRQVQEWIRRAATDSGISTQETIFLDGFTDARALQIVRGGRHAGAISVPCRYTHSPVETFQKTDADETVALLTAAIESEFPSRENSR